MVTIKLEEQIIQAPKGSNLRQVLLAAGVFLDSPCGGKGTCGKCRVELQGELTPPTKAEQQLLPKNNPLLRLACQVELLGDVQVFLPQSKEIGIELLQTSDHGVPLGAAVDLGTTTLQAYLVDLTTGAQLATAKMANPQASFGADLISRLAFAQEEGEETLTLKLRRGVQRLLAQLMKTAGREPGQLESLVLVGNSAIHHFWWGFETVSLAQAPYMPLERKAKAELASKLGLSLAPEAQVYFLPLVAGFVGADTVAAVLATELDQREGIKLLVDLGTNGELVLAKDGTLLAASTAAGPALEGGEIGFGMRAGKGAIEAVAIENSHVGCKVIGDAKPLGICGSGLLDLLAQLLKAGLVDKTGRLLSQEEFLAQGGDPKLSSRLTKDGFQVAEGAHGPIFITAGDLRKLQLAKGAVRAGIEILLSAEEVKAEELDEIILAGAFGSYLHPESALAIGLLPQVAPERIKSAGNAAGEGAVRVLVSPEAKEDAERLAREIQYLELAGHKEFQDRFVDALLFS